MKLICPIQNTFLVGGNICLVNQLFGENKNTQLYDPQGNLVGGYGPDGHTGIDMRTIGDYKYKRYNQKFDPVMGWTGQWVKEDRDPFEKIGDIPVVASHNGYLTTNVFVKDKQKGWGMFIEGEKGSDEEGFRTLYWHINSPWSSLQSFMGALTSKFLPRYVTAGSVIAIAGNSGMSTAPHLHHELQQKQADGSWKPIDPMPFYSDESVIYQKGEMGERRWWYQGKEVTETEFRFQLNLLPKSI